MPSVDVGDVHVPSGGGGSSRLEAGIREEMEEHGIPRELAEKLARDHLAKDPDYYGGDIEAKSAHSHEYLTAFHAATRKQVPRWQAELIHQSALPASGGAAGRRRPQHGALELAGLRKLAPDHVRDMSDDDLTAAWEQLGGWHAQATRKKMDVTDYERAASFCAQELARRGLKWDQESPLGQAATAHGTLGKRTDMLPREIVLAKAAALALGDSGLELLYHGAMGDDGAVSGALASVGVPLAKSRRVSDLDDQPEALYELLLRRPGVVLDDLPPLHFTPTELAKAATAEKRLIWYVVAEPGVPDTYGDVITAEEVEDACHRFALGPRKVFLEHGEKVRLNADGRFPAEITGLAHVVESALAPMVLTEFFGTIPPRPIPTGSWIGCLYFPEASLWQRMRDGNEGISWRGPAAKDQR
jgi:hypothetical protein